MKYALSSGRLKECEGNLGGLLSCPIPTNDLEFSFFQSKKRHLTLELNQLRMIEDRYWRQKFKIRWLKEDDQNTFFFHMVVSGHYSSFIISTMLSLSDNTNADVIKYVVSKAFKQRCMNSRTLYIEEWDAQFPSLASEVFNSLETPFTEDEIFQVLKDVDGDKAPGPDDFPLKFLRCSWDTFKDELVGLFHAFHASG